MTDRPSPGHPTAEAIAVLDFGSQYAQLIVRRVRECNVYCRLFPWDVPAERLAAFHPQGIILSGGPASVYGEGAPQLQQHVLDLGKPILGICYGMQALAHLLGGQVSRAPRREYGQASLDTIAADSPLFEGLPAPQSVWMSHGDQVTVLPPGFRAIAASDNSPIAAMADARGRIYGLQFHPEVAHTPQGTKLLRNFLYRVCGCHGLWTASSFITEAIAQIREQVGESRAVCGLSGGVDSSVAAALVERAIGDRLTCIFVDHGFLRKDEAKNNMAAFLQYLGSEVIYVDAEARFMGALAGVSEPEEKRRRIGETFVRVFERTAEEVGQADFLVQGTLYPDVIESAGTGRSSARIKTHHNVGGLPEDMRFKLVEPLRDLFKDEVRRVGIELGLPKHIVYRQPFPGPGLAVRIMGEVTRDRLDRLREADAIVTSEIEAWNASAAGLGGDGAAGMPRQYFAVLPSVKSVGVMGDERTYAELVGIRAVTTEDFMTADWARLPYDLLARMASRIVNEVSGVNRVVYDITSKPPGTIEWE